MQEQQQETHEVFGDPHLAGVMMFLLLLHLLQVYVAILNLQVVGSCRDEGNTTVSPILGEVCRWASVLLSKAAAA